MALVAVILDSSPLGLITQKSGKSPDGDACRAWMENAHGVRIYVPEVADYEVRRELIRAQKHGSIVRLDRQQSPDDFRRLCHSVCPQGQTADERRVAS